jgi:prepilin-type N-terminal cleavage/methylation domain-containing protein
MLLKRHDPRDQGFTLSELLVSMTIFGLLMGFTFAILISIMYQSADTQSRALALTDMRLGISQIDRQVRSGDVILDPAAEPFSAAGVDKFYSMRILTQEDGKARCAQWRVIDHEGNGFGNLEFRTWDPAYPSVDEYTPWGVVAHNIVDVGVHPDSVYDITDDPRTWPPFWVDKGPVGSATQAQFVRVTLRLKAPGGDPDSIPASVTTVITGRNTVFGYPSSSCSHIPPY